MITVLIIRTIAVAGTDFLQYLPQPTGWPAFAITEVPTTFADAPIGVALPPTSVPIANAQESVGSAIPEVADSDSITGIIVAANGMLSTNALAIADTGKSVVIQKVTGKDAVRQHLAELGFVVDSEVVVVNELNGNLIVQVKDSRIALDHTMANRIMI